MAIFAGSVCFFSAVLALSLLQSNWYEEEEVGKQWSWIIVVSGGYNLSLALICDVLLQTDEPCSFVVSCTFARSVPEKTHLMLQETAIFSPSSNNAMLYGLAGGQQGNETLHHQWGETSLRDLPPSSL